MRIFSPLGSCIIMITALGVMVVELMKLGPVPGPADHLVFFPTAVDGLIDDVVAGEEFPPVDFFFMLTNFISCPSFSMYSDYGRFRISRRAQATPSSKLARVWRSAAARQLPVASATATPTPARRSISMSLSSVAEGHGPGD